MENNKTITNGYYQLPNGQWMHFSTNCWKNLLNNTGRTAVSWELAYKEAYTKASQEKDPSKRETYTLEQYTLLSEVGFAAARAYNQEEDIEIDFNFFKFSSWMDELGADEALNFYKALTWNSSLPAEAGKPQGSNQTPKKKKRK